MEKRKAHHDIDAIKAEFATVATLRITTSALKSAEALAITLQGVVDIVQGMTRRQFYKSMTSQWSSAVWQDVYHVPHEKMVLYVKFTTDAQGHLLISFKEK